MDRARRLPCEAELSKERLAARKASAIAQMR
jgi:hypothetical protein